jgi:pSer/pThr/pTyr-binding forkhead associated (FHA) protein/ferredoxin
MPRLTVEGSGTFVVPAGKRLVNALVDECGVDQLHVCGGLAKCGTCRVVFLAGEPTQMRPAESATLAALGMIGQPGLRLSCQVTCDTDMSVRLVSRLVGSGHAAGGPRPADAIEPAGGPPPGREPGREVESFRIVKWLTSPDDRAGGRGEAFEPEEPLYRPVLRPPVPVLTALDDGSMDVGEEIRIRKSPFVIGRSGGDLMLPNDPTISKEHAELRLVGTRGVAQWTLQNLGSVNGTFVRVNHTSFLSDTIVILGSRRYRLEGPFRQPGGQPTGGDGTLPADRESPELAWPTLVESSGRADGVRHVIRKPTVTIGGVYGGCDIELDDPLVARHHATLRRDSAGVWQLAAGRTRNGVWANIQSVVLTPYCYFQCGEQRFRFMIP